MVKDHVFVTSGDGNLGFRTICALEKGHLRRCNIFAGVHRPSQVALAGIKAVVAHPVPVDAEDPRSLDIAFEDVRKVFIIPSPDPLKLKHGKAYIDAAVRAGVEFILLLSAVCLEQRTDQWAKEFREMEDMLHNSGVRHGFLRVPLFMQDLFYFADQINKDKVLKLPIGDGPFAPIDMDDVAKCAAKILDSTEEFQEPPHIGDHSLTGPDLATGADMAKIGSKVLDYAFKFQNCSRGETKQHLLERAHLPEAEAEALVEVFEIIAKGKLNYRTPHAKEILGEEPKTLESFFMENKREFVQLFGKEE